MDFRILRAAVVQMNAKEDVDANLTRAGALLEEAAGHGTAPTESDKNQEEGP